MPPTKPAQSQRAWRELSERLGHVERWIETSTLRGWGAGGLLSALCVALILMCSDLKTEGTALYADPGWDRHLYRLMAEDGLFELRLAPFSWRVLMPALAGWSPFGLQASFMTVTFAALWGSGTVLFQIARRRGQPASASALGVLLFYSLGWGTKFIAADFWIPDGVALLLVTLALWASFERRLYAFGLLIFLGALTKESVLLAAPLYYCLNVSRPLDRRFALRSLGVLLPAAAATLALRLGLPQQNDNSAYIATLPENISRFPELFGRYNYARLLNDIGYDQRVREWSFDAFLAYTVSPFGVALPLLAGIAFRRSARLVLGMLPFFVLTYAQLLFATDTQRLLVLVAPCIMVLALEGVSELRERTGIEARALLPFGAALFALVLIGPRQYEVRFESQALVVGLAVVTVFLAARRPPPPRL